MSQSTITTSVVSSANPDRHDSTAVRPRVWILDDSPMEVQVALEALAPFYSVEAFNDGAVLLERLSEGSIPNALVLDWHLPGMSGVEVCRFVRMTHHEAALPALLFTATRAATEDLIEALDAGANDFVAKPYNNAELCARVATLVRIQSQHARVLAAEQAMAELLRREREATETSERALAALQDEATFRERFISILGHDLRTPLTAIAMTASVELRPADLAPPRRVALQRIATSAGRMDRMIRDLLDFARSRSGSEIPLTRTDVDLGAVCQRVLSEVHSVRPDRVLDFVNTSTGHGAWDPDRAEQVVTNLVVNALDYSAPGSPVTLALRDDGEAGEAVVLAVHNSGAAIPPGEIDTLFDPFRRGNPQTAGRPSQGLGLGLFIVHQIVRAHGGTVTVVSSEDAGTTFTVRWPRAVPPRA